MRLLNVNAQKLELVEFFGEQIPQKEGGGGGIGCQRARQRAEPLRSFLCGSLLFRDVACGWRVEERSQAPACCIRSVSQTEVGAEAVAGNDVAM
jgi:hypothetical protein